MVPTAPVLFTGMDSPLVRSFRGSFASLRKAGFAVREGRLDHSAELPLVPSSVIRAP